MCQLEIALSLPSNIFHTYVPSPHANTLRTKVYEINWLIK